MKKAICSFFAAIALATCAAPEKIAVARVAHVDDVVAAAQRIGDLTGNAMLGIMASGQIAEMPYFKWFGEMRKGAGVSVVVYADVAKCNEASDIESLSKALEDSLGVGFLYPTTRTKADFLKAHPEAVVTNGTYAVTFKDEGECDEDDGEDCTSCETKMFVQYSADGRWMAIDSSPESAKMALTAVADAERPFNGSVFEVVILPKAFRALEHTLKLVETDPACAECMKECTKEMFAFYQSCVSGVDGAGFSVTVDAGGVTVDSSATTKTGSVLDVIGRKTLGADALDFAGSDACIACACAADCGYGEIAETVDKVFAVLAKHGIDVTKFIAREKIAENVEKVTVDAKAIKAFADDPETEKKMKAVDAEKLGAELQAILTAGTKPTFVGKPFSAAIALKGASAAEKSVAERFAFVLPGAAAKKPFSVNYLSVYSLARTLLTQFRDDLPKNARKSLDVVMMSLPKKIAGGCASANWREGNVLKSTIRVSADEFRSVSGLVTLAIMIMNGEDDAE